MRYRAGTAERRWCTERTAWGATPSRARRPRLVGALSAVRVGVRRGVRLGVVLAVTASAATGCGGGARDDESRRPQGVATGASAGDSAAAGPSAATPTGAVGAKPICPATGTWQMCSVIERLERAGLAPRREEDLVREPPLSAPGVAIMLGRSELRVFLYADRAARERDQARLDRKKYVSAADPLSMEAEPTLIGSENLLAILRSRSDHQRERVSDALTAGPPQRPGTKG